MERTASINNMVWRARDGAEAVDTVAVVWHKRQRIRSWAVAGVGGVRYANMESCISSTSRAAIRTKPIDVDGHVDGVGTPPRTRVAAGR